MRCPLCKMDTLAPVRPLDYVEIDCCDMCNGLWFDKGELSTLTNRKEDVPFLAEGLDSAKPKGKDCPRCNVVMVEMPYEKGSRLLIDYCRDCGGVWLDPMEFESVKSIAKKTGAEPPKPPAPARASGSVAAVPPGAAVTGAAPADPAREERRRILAQMVIEIRRKMGTDLQWECPVCCTKTLHQFTTSEGITIDMCDTCRGMFFEKGELGDTLEISVDVPGGTERVAQAKVAMKECPRCAVYMKELPFLEDEDLLIDVCEECGGIWTDSGEFHKLEHLCTKVESAGSRFGMTLKKLDEKGYRVLGIG